MLQRIRVVDESATPDPTVTDFFRTFDEEMHSLYLLSFLLTADHDKAEQCLVSAMGECVDGVGAFMDWARSSTRRAVVKCAIQMIMPAPEHADYLSLISHERAAAAAENDPFSSILLLDAFERFVFVMACLEGQSDEECAILLGCSRHDVMMARVLAIKRQLSADALAGEILQS
jgi:hypothetical protein